MAQSVEQRVQAVRILLSSALDYLPTPVTSSGLIARSAPPGPAPGKRVPCGYCRRAGRIRTHGRGRICPVCEGSGWRRRRGVGLASSHPDFEEAWDEYTESPVKDAAQNPGSMPSHLIDSALERLDYERAAREGDSSSERFGWEKERSLYDAKGSYRELHRVLRVMRVQWPPGYRQVLRVYFWGVQFRPTLEDGRFLEVAELWIAQAMRGPVRVPPWLAEHEAAMERRKTIKDLAADGLSAGAIARRTGIPKGTVRKRLFQLSDR